eukprot:comp21548_c0_seq1/m.30042 comp21548_c0_seq1/g.30042  ORF comp21548_c0_seq1/g.30042 comp21548_c0_seq1/m.30042 type:complete len:296 (-) comp21548_c0_seq1:550-1437(-)
MCTSNTTQNSCSFGTQQCPYGHHEIPLCVFVREVLRRAEVTKSVFLVSLIYSYRVNAAIHAGAHKDYPKLQCPRCLFVGCCLLASKYLDDEVFLNSQWAAWAGMPCSDINRLELTTLQALEHNLYIEPALFQRWALMYTSRVRTPDHDVTIAQQLVTVVLGNCQLFARANAMEAPLRLSQPTPKPAQPQPLSLEHLRAPTYSLSVDVVVHTANGIARRRPHASKIMRRNCAASASVGAAGQSANSVRGHMYHPYANKIHGQAAGAPRRGSGAGGAMGEATLDVTGHVGQALLTTA